MKATRWPLEDCMDLDVTLRCGALLVFDATGCTHARGLLGSA
jgi:ribosomal protein L40E